ncbi:carbohydrate kinase [Geminocystis sp. NIES-3708]|uniref:FGGY-family carbohydrate kinase n=1 Tax=Geminocystis sp. NIES-3708 TaxID=1615909 RepID=UPI0005FC4903|nr:FGGY-family carbohydrate kinase [Geminocystis sp. NIES-3708]BAQ59703.1 carbohydrate kinase [Geminocystis sp. NIES-3708]
MNYYLGLDFGTSGARGIIIDEAKQIILNIKTSQNNYSQPQHWQQALQDLLSQIPLNIAQHLQAIAIDGTSSTVVLCDNKGNSIDDPLWYSDNRGKKYLSEIAKFAPENHLVISAASSLAKLYWWYQQPIFKNACYFLHQADWLAFLLHGKLGISDYHNALKLGYDLISLDYPQWLKNQPFFDILPQITVPGAKIARITPQISKLYQINPDCVVKAGTTDSIAAFLASEVTQAGEAVTSIGSTLVLKLLSKTKIDDNRYGIYSHKLGDLWLTGGASNTGGAVLKHFFDENELQKLSLKINPNLPTNLYYYPLLNKGDRFPINNPNLEPKITPRPKDNVIFLQGLLEGIADIEAKGYELLKELGATPLTKVYTAGGGAKNETWGYIREKRLKVNVSISPQTEAAYGTALLAKSTVLV